MTAVTDVDGFYLIVYKTGKELPFTAVFDTGVQTYDEEGSIKANRFVVLNHQFS